MTVRGTFDPDHQFMVRYRSLGPASGYEVLTPLHTTTGAWVLVDRGFGTKRNDEDYPSTLPAPPTGEVDILGYVRRDEQGSTEAITPVAPGNTVRLVNSAAIAGTLPYPLVNGFVSVIEITPAQAGDPDTGHAAGADRGQPLLICASMVRVRRNGWSRVGAADPFGRAGDAPRRPGAGNRTRGGAVRKYWIVTVGLIATLAACAAPTPAGPAPQLDRDELVGDGHQRPARPSPATRRR